MPCIFNGNPVRMSLLEKCFLINLVHNLTDVVMENLFFCVMSRLGANRANVHFSRDLWNVEIKNGGNSSL